MGTRRFTALKVVAALAAAIVLVAVGYKLVAKQTACSDFKLDSARWIKLMQQPRHFADDDEWLQETADNLSRCGTFDGLKFSEVREQLGTPAKPSLARTGGDQVRPSWVWYLDARPATDPRPVKALIVELDRKTGTVVDVNVATVAR